MSGVETARTIAFSVRKIVIIPLNNGGGVSLGQPIVIDTPDTAELKFMTTLEQGRGGAYQFPLAVEPKEAKAELTAKLLDCPPALLALTMPGTYVKVTTSGPAVDSVTNITGSSVATRCSGTITSGSPPSGLYAIVPTAAQVYQVYDMQTGRPAAATVTTSASTTTTDTASIPNITISTAAGTFVVGDAGNLEVVNIGASGTGEVAMETVTGPSVYPITLPNVYIIVDAMRRGVLYQFDLYYCVIGGASFPAGQGKIVMPDFTAHLQQPPFNAGSPIPYRYRRIA